MSPQRRHRRRPRPVPRRRPRRARRAGRRRWATPAPSRRRCADRRARARRRAVRRPHAGGGGVQVIRDVAETAPDAALPGAFGVRRRRGRDRGHPRRRARLRHQDDLGAELADAVRRVDDGDAVFSPRLAGFVLDAFARRRRARRPSIRSSTSSQRASARCCATSPAATSTRRSGCAEHLGQDRRGARLGGAPEAAAVQPPRAQPMGGGRLVTSGSTGVALEGAGVAPSAPVSLPSWGSARRSAGCPPPLSTAGGSARGRLSLCRAPRSGGCRGGGGGPACSPAVFPSRLLSRGRGAGSGGSPPGVAAAQAGREGVCGAGGVAWRPRARSGTARPGRRRPSRRCSASGCRRSSRGPSRAPTRSGAARSRRSCPWVSTPRRRTPDVSRTASLRCSLLFRSLSFSTWIPWRERTRMSWINCGFPAPAGRAWRARSRGR